MKKKWLFITLLSCLTAFVTGCQDDMGIDRLEQETARPMNAVFELSLAIEGQTDNPTEQTKPDSTKGNNIEKRISSVQLFIVPLDDEDKEQWNNIRFGETAVPEEYDTSKPIKVQVAGVTPNTHVYVGANMNPEQTDAFIREKKEDGYYEMKRNDFPTYYSAINQLAPFHHDSWMPNFNRDPQNIVMFSTAALKVDKNNITEIIDKVTGEKKTEIKLGTATLKRVVAKVLLTCESVDGSTASSDSSEVAHGAVEGVQYVKMKNQLVAGNLGPTGWIRQKNVYYFINNMPRRVRFFQEYEAKDPNGVEKPVPTYNLKKIIKDVLNVQFSPIRFDREKIKDVFIHYDINELYKRYQSFRPSEVWDQTAYTNLIQNKESRYSDEKVGMYTAENMFGVDYGDFREEELKQMKEYSDLPFLTKVAIAAKFTPRFIFVTEKEWSEGLGSFRPMAEHEAGSKILSDCVVEIEQGQYPGYRRLKCDNEEVAQEILTYSLKMHGHLLEDGKDYDAEKAPYMYPAETFFVYFRGDDVYYSTYGVASVNNDKNQNWPEMIPYTRGWSYYYTHINNERSAPVEHVSEICIERNNYYILKLTSIGTLGTSVGDKKYIEVHTLKSDWMDGGSGNVTLQ